MGRPGIALVAVCKSREGDYITRCDNVSYDNYRLFVRGRGLSRNNNKKAAGGTCRYPVLRVLECDYSGSVAISSFIVGDNCKNPFYIEAPASIDKLKVFYCTSRVNPNSFTDQGPIMGARIHVSTIHHYIPKPYGTLKGSHDYLRQQHKGLPIAAFTGLLY